MSIWRMRIAFWIPKITNTHASCVMLIAFRLRERLHERASMLLYICIASLVMIYKHLSSQAVKPRRGLMWLFSSSQFAYEKCAVRL